MKQYEKKYKDYFRSDSYQDKFEIDDLEAVGMDKDEFRNQFSAVMDQYYDNLWRDGLNLAWITRKFEYGGQLREHFTKNNKKIDTAFGVYLRKFLNKDSSTLVSNKALKAIASYADTFYPGFYTDSPPWQQNYGFPFDHLTLDYLLAVYRMEDRVEFLEYAEEYELSLEDFYDYMLNWISCYNEEHGEIYTMRKVPFVHFNEI